MIQPSDVRAAIVMLVVAGFVIGLAVGCAGTALVLGMVW